MPERNFPAQTLKIFLAEFWKDNSFEGIDILEYGYTIGSYIGTVTSTYSNAYPEDGVSGSYWYVYQGMS